MARPREPVPAAICARLIEFLSEGNTLAEFCRREGIGARTVYDWLRKDEDFAADYARARETGAHVIADDLLRIADAATDEDVQSSRLKVDVRKWLLARWLPKSYGDRTAADVADGATVVVVTGVPRDRETHPTPGRCPPELVARAGEEHQIPDTQIPNTPKPRLEVEIDPPTSSDSPQKPPAE